MTYLMTKATELIQNNRHQEALPMSIKKAFVDTKCNVDSGRVKTSYILRIYFNILTGKCLNSMVFLCEMCSFLWFLDNSTSQIWDAL